MTDKRVRVMNEIISGIIRACTLAFYIVLINLFNFMTFSTYAGTGNKPTAKKVFTFISLMYISSLYFVEYVNRALLSISEMNVTVQRIQVNISS